MSLDWVRRHWLVLAVASVAIIGVEGFRISQRVASVGVVAATVIIVIVAWNSGSGDRGREASIRLALRVTVLVFMATAIPVVQRELFGTFPARDRLLLGAAILVYDLSGQWRSRSSQRVIGSLIILVTAMTASVFIIGNPDPKIDVMDSQVAGAQVLFNGQNPYSEVVFEDSGPPEANVGAIIGYPYPPVTMLPYVVVQRALDARFAGLVGFVAALGLMLWMASRSSSLGVLVVGVAVTFPTLGGVVVYGWTEPLSLALLAAGTMALHRPTRSAVLSGLAFTSKQYLVLAAIPYLTSRRAPPVRALAIGAAVAGIVLLPFIVWDAGAFFHAVVGVQFGRLPRSDTLSVGALGVDIPVALTLIAATVVGVALGRRAARRAGVLAAQAATMATYFALSINSFKNYWWIVAMAVLAAVSMGLDGPDDGPGSALRERIDPERRRTCRIVSQHDAQT